MFCPCLINPFVYIIGNKGCAKIKSFLTLYPVIVFYKKEKHFRLIFKKRQLFYKPRIQIARLRLQECLTKYPAL